ncbi:hypothetical protein [Aeromonas veronii]|uniref:hypothetical protein n=1 Tax=Aeromonas veronii TaxID=654 RepID=UPI0024432B81|nr:hypothetical protein [Aeromonas veronii]
MTVPRDAPAGRYLGNIQLLSQQQLVQLPLTIEVLPLTLPAASKPVGIYVEAPPLSELAEPQSRGVKRADRRGQSLRSAAARQAGDQRPLARSATG